MNAEFLTIIEALIQKAPTGWLSAVCDVLRSLPSDAPLEAALQRLPTTHNATLAYLVAEALQVAADQMSWEALGWTLQTTAAAYYKWQAEHHIEMLWAGPVPANQVPARRIDQALYDQIANAEQDILLVTFAAAKIQLLAEALWAAAQRSVPIRLILEFEEDSQGQLSYDALKAFPPSLRAAVEVYHWPIERREKNQAGRPGKLHAKLAVIDDTVFISSANLTDDAFNRNLEIGIMAKQPELLASVQAYISALIAQKMIELI